jgi:hypothetical protein
MNRKGLLEADEDEFLHIVRMRARTECRHRIVDALLEESDDVEYQDLMENVPSDNESDSADDDSDNDSDSEDENDDNSIEKGADLDLDRVQIHDPILHDHIHCPPFEDIACTFRGAQCDVCDCDDFCLALCLQENNFQFFKDLVYVVDFEEEMLLAKESVDLGRRKPNNEVRKFLYKKIFVCLDFGVVEKGERKRLPNCAVAKIRQIYPSESGSYMGFKEH